MSEMSAASGLRVETIPVRFDEAEHVYTDVENGRLYPGVTTVLQAAGKPWLGPWMLKQAMEELSREWKPGESYTLTARDAILASAKGAHTRTSRKAKETGTDAHTLIEREIAKKMGWRGTNGHQTIVDEDAQRAVAAWRAWDALHRPEYLLLEQPVCSRLFWYAGTLDLVVRCGGRVGIVDIKTSRDIYPEHFVQLAAYQRALEEWTRERFVFRAVLQTPKDGKPFVWREAPFSVEEDFEYFNACLVLHRYRQAVEPRR